jgi:hypothetical protein
LSAKEGLFDFAKGNLTPIIYKLITPIPQGGRRGRRGERGRGERGRGERREEGEREGGEREEERGRRREEGGIPQV